jgi:type II secretory pathway pseudopilin PulG
MMGRISIRRRKKPEEEGFILLGVIILVALFVIAMAVAAPKVAQDIQRDRDLETMHRGKQYIRGIQLYYRKFHAYPPSIDALVKTNEIRFIRKRYIDPTTGKDDWKPIMFGQNKTPMAMGFFGQPLGGTGGNVLAGTGPSGGNGISGATPIGSSSSFGGSTGNSIFGSDNSTSSGTTGNTQAGSSTTTGTSDNSGNNSSSNSGSSSSDSSSSNSFGGSSDSGFTLGGGIIGVSPVSSKQSIVVYKKMDHYNQWEFLYSPLQDQPVITTTSSGPTGNSTTDQSGFGTNSPTTSSGTTGNTNGNGTPTSPTTTSQPF